MTMTRHVIDESCSCGSTFHYEGNGPNSARVAASQWRAEHQHNTVNGVLVVPGGMHVEVDNLEGNSPTLKEDSC